MLSTISRALIYAAFFTLPFTFIKVYSNLTLSDLLFFLTFLTILMSTAGKSFIVNSVLMKNEFAIPMLIFSLGFFLSLPASNFPIESLTAYLQIIFIFFIAYPVLVEVIKDENQVKRIALMLIIPGVVIGMLMITIKIIGVNIGIDLLAREGWRGRLSYGGMEPNIPGRIMLQNIPFLAVFALSAKKYSYRFISLSLIVIQLTAILLTSSRSNFVTFIMGSILFSIFFIQSGKRIQFKYVLYAGLIGAVIIMTFYSINNEFFEKPFERYGTIFNAQKSPSSLQRIRVINEGFKHINQNPITGLGLGDSYLATKVSLHNPIILTWLENGIFGIVGFTAVYLTLLLQGYKLYKRKFDGKFILIGLTIVMIMMIFGDMFMANSYKRVLWLPALLFMAHSKNYLSAKLEQATNV